ncbi:TIGR03668 family PPOX class F420-dependent oxidoreductase [Streptomonospora sediminis]
MRWNTEQCRERFARARVARLATADSEGRPHLVPVTFALLTGTGTGTGSGTGAGGWAGQHTGAAGTADTVVIAIDHKPKRTTRVRRLANIAANPQVSLLADEYAEDWERLWWVRADGRAGTIEPGTESQDAPPEHRTAVRHLQERYSQYRDTPPGGPVILIDITRWSGWSFA